MSIRKCRAGPGSEVCAGGRDQVTIYLDGIFEAMGLDRLATGDGLKGKESEAKRKKGMRTNVIEHLYLGEEGGQE